MGIETGNLAQHTHCNAELCNTEDVLTYLYMAQGSVVCVRHYKSYELVRFLYSQATFKYTLRNEHCWLSTHQYSKTVMSKILPVI
jgi:hypothetical protein